MPTCYKYFIKTFRTWAGTSASSEDRVLGTGFTIPETTKNLTQRSKQCFSDAGHQAAQDSHPDGDTNTVSPHHHHAAWRPRPAPVPAGGPGGAPGAQSGKTAVERLRRSKGSPSAQGGPAGCVSASGPRTGRAPPETGNNLRVQGWGHSLVQRTGEPPPQTNVTNVAPNAALLSLPTKLKRDFKSIKLFLNN